MYDLNATSIFGRGYEYRAAGVLARTRENVKTLARYVAMATTPTTLLYLLLTAALIESFPRLR